MTSLIESVDGRVRRWLTRGLGRSWVVAVSGGGDSVALARILAQAQPRLGLTLAIAHLNHQARGAESDADEAFVRDLAGQLGIPCDVGRWRAEGEGGFEAEARRARYQWLVERAIARGATVIAAAHTLDDQAETILHRIVRGTGVHGLRGMRPLRVLNPSPKIVLARPLLAIGRDELRAFLEERGQHYREDSSNTDMRRTRARIRHQLLPTVAALYNPQIAPALARLGKSAAAHARVVDEMARALEPALRVSDPSGAIVFRRVDLAAVPRFMRTELLRKAWRDQGWPEQAMSAERWRRLAALAPHASAPPCNLGGGVEAVVSQDLLILRRRLEPINQPADETADSIPLEIPGTAEVAWAFGSIVARLDPMLPADETLDLDQLAPPLVIDIARPGDRFDPLGMNGQTTPLADFLRGRRIPRPRRSTIPIVRDQRGIVWVVGHRISHHARITPETRHTLSLRFQQHPPRLYTD